MSEQLVASTAGFILGFSLMAAFCLKNIQTTLKQIARDIEKLKQ